MGTTRTSKLGAAGAVTASALALSLGLTACSSSDDGGGSDSAAATHRTSGAADSAGSDGSANGPADLVDLLPGQEAFGQGFTVSPVSVDDFAETMQKAQTASDNQTSDPPQCKSVLNTAGDIDPQDSAIETATNSETRTTMAVIATHADTVLDTARTHLDDCASFTMSGGDLSESVEVAQFAPAGAEGDQAIGLTRTETIADKAVRTTITAANALDGVGVQVITQQLSADPLPEDIVDRLQQKSSGILQTVTDEITQG